jgi:hypothetical protein
MSKYYQLIRLKLTMFNLTIFNYNPFLGPDNGMQKIQTEEKLITFNILYTNKRSVTISTSKTFGNLIDILSIKFPGPMHNLNNSVIIKKRPCCHFGPIGYKYLLDAVISESNIADEKQLELHIDIFAGTAKYQLYAPYIYYKHNLKWPPASNWDDGDPINLGDFLIWLGWGHGSCVPPPRDEYNAYCHLVILNYNGIYKVINKYGFAKALGYLPCGKDPLTNKMLSGTMILKLRQILSLDQKKAYDLPIPILDVVFEK